MTCFSGANLKIPYVLTNMYVPVTRHEQNQPETAPPVYRALLPACGKKWLNST